MIDKDDRQELQKTIDKYYDEITAQDRSARTELIDMKIQSLQKERERL